MKDIEKTELPEEQYRIINGQKVYVSRRKRRRNMSLYYLIVFIFVLMALLFLSLTVFFNIKTIDVSGTNLYTKEQILGIANINIKDNLFRIDTKQAKENIMASFPYLEDVRITRKFPSTLKIEAVQAVACANIENSDGTYTVVSTTGRILEAKTSAKDASLITIKGMELKSMNLGETFEDKDNIKTNIVKDIISEANTLGMNRLSMIDISNRTDIKMNYDSRLDIEIGSSVDIPFKLKCLDAVIEKLSENYEGTIIYHNSTSGISVIPKDDGKNKKS